MDPGGTTKTDPSVDDWSIDDNVFRLRHWASELTRKLPEPTDEIRIIGSNESCWLRLEDSKSCVSGRHAALVHEAGRWIIRDLGSKNGMRVDGQRREEVVLEPGIEIKIGGVTLLAESPRFAALRGFLRRILGWETAQATAVDVALRAIRMAAARRAALVLCGEDDLIPLARSLHRRYLGADRPFVVCDPRRKSSEENVRNAENHVAGMPALLAATRGSLCVWNNKLPSDFDEVKAALKDPDVRVHLTVCARNAAEAEAFGAVAIAIPSLADRKDELARIVAEYAADASLELVLPVAAFSRVDHAWVLKHETKTLPRIEKATQRLIALRAEDGNMSRAAVRLGMARMSLYKWIGRRTLPVLQP